MYKWTHTVQTHVVQESIVHEKLSNDPGIQGKITGLSYNIPLWVPTLNNFMRHFISSTHFAIENMEEYLTGFKLPLANPLTAFVA